MADIDKGKRKRSDEEGNSPEDLTLESKKQKTEEEWGPEYDSINSDSSSEPDYEGLTEHEICILEGAKTPPRNRRRSRQLRRKFYLDAARKAAEESSNVEGDLEGTTIDDTIPVSQQRGSSSLTEAQLDIFGIAFATSDITAGSLDDPSLAPDYLAPYSQRRQRGLRKRHVRIPRAKYDLFGRLAEYPELFMDVALSFDMLSLMALYAISKDCFQIINGHMLHTMRSYAQLYAPESGRIHNYHMYRNLCIPDPANMVQPGSTGTTTTEQRLIPSFRWLQMVMYRDKCVRHIRALLARETLRVPRSMHETLLKVWVVMDIATSAQRAKLMHNEDFFTDVDIYNIVFFSTKFDMFCNDPLSGPADDAMRELLLGQRGLTSLKDFMKGVRFTTKLEIMELSWRYELYVSKENRHLSLIGIPGEELGKGHLEGWGAGRVHLLRPDELAMMESVRRNMGLSRHILHMMTWGYVDPVTLCNIDPEEDEMYMSDLDLETKDGWTGIEDDVVSLEDQQPAEGEGLANVGGQQSFEENANNEHVSNVSGVLQQEGEPIDALDMMDTEEEAGSAANSGIGLNGWQDIFAQL